MRTQVWAVPRDGGLWQIMVAARDGRRYTERPVGQPVGTRMALKRIRFHTTVARWCAERGTDR